MIVCIFCSEVVISRSRFTPHVFPTVAEGPSWTEDAAGVGLSSNADASTQPHPWGNADHVR